jgi:hypothetical protein
MKRIILIALLASCGTEDSKETPTIVPHKSTEPTVTLDKPKTDIVTVAKQEEPTPLPTRTYGKARKGMTKAEAIEALGEPEDVTSYTNFVVWSYPESFCSLYTCSLEFDKTGILTKVEGLKAQFVDLASF